MTPIAFCVKVCFQKLHRSLSGFWRMFALILFPVVRFHFFFFFSLIFNLSKSFLFIALTTCKWTILQLHGMLIILRRNIKIHYYWAMKNCGEDPDKLRALIENIADHYQVFHIPGYYFSPKDLTSIIRIQIYDCSDLFSVVLLTNYNPSNVICFSLKCVTATYY